MNELEYGSSNKMAKQLIGILTKITRKQKIKKIFSEKDYRHDDKQISH